MRGYENTTERDKDTDRLDLRPDERSECDSYQAIGCSLRFNLMPHSLSEAEDAISHHLMEA